MNQDDLKVLFNNGDPRVKVKEESKAVAKAEPVKPA